METGSPLARSPASPLSTPDSPPNKRSFLSRLRRNPSSVTNASPYPQPAHAASTSAIPNTQSQDRDQLVGKKLVGMPIMFGMNRSELFGSGASAKRGLAQKDETEYERLRALPRVRLVPPEDEGEPILLYPPPHGDRPSCPPPPPPSAFLSPTSLPQRPGTPSQASTRRPASIYSNSPTWAGMADGFVLPPPKFTRTSVGWGEGAPPVSMGVVLPKTRGEVNEDRRRRMSGVGMASWSASGRMRSLESQEEIAVNKRMRLADAEEPVLEADEHAALENENTERPTSPPAGKPTPIIQVDAPAPAPRTEPSEHAAILAPAQQAASHLASEASVPFPSTVPSPLRSSTMPTDVSASPMTSVAGLPAPIEAPVPKAIRRTRALSLSAAFSFSPSFKDMQAPPLPPAPTPTPSQRAAPTVRKQKSLKNLFFSSSTPPEATVLPPPLPSAPPASVEERGWRATDNKQLPREDKNKGKKIIQKARSKPSLKIDVKVAKPTSNPCASETPATPALSTGHTEVSSAVIETPGSAHPVPSQPRELGKRFSLSNMSQAFKRMSSMSNVNINASAGSAGPPSGTPRGLNSSSGSVSGSGSGSGSPVPMVPDLPEVYKRQKEAKWKTKASAISIGPRRAKTLDTETGLREEVLTPTGMPRRSETLNAVHNVTMREGETIDSPSELEKQVLTASPVARVNDMSSPPRPLPVLGHVHVPARSPSPVSISTVSSADDEEEEEEVMDEQELVHAKLMHVSPRTDGRRDPSVSQRSLQELLVQASGRAASNVVIVPNKGVRRSVEAIVIGSAGTGYTSASNLASTPRARESVVLGLSLDRVMERRGSETEEEEMLATPMDDFVELFPDGLDTPSEDNGRSESDDAPTTTLTAAGERSTAPSDSVSPNAVRMADEASSVPSCEHETTSLPGALDLDLALDQATVDNWSQASPRPLVSGKNRLSSPDAPSKRLSSSQKAAQSLPHLHTEGLGLDFGGGGWGGQVRVGAP